MILFVCLFDSLRPINNLSVKQGQIFRGWTSTKLGCVLLKDHNAVTLVRLEPAAPRSWVKHSTNEPLHSHYNDLLDWLWQWSYKQHLTTVNQQTIIPFFNTDKHTHTKILHFQSKYEHALK